MFRIALSVVLVSAWTSIYAQDAAPVPPPTWTGSFAAGLSLTRGNSETKNINLAADAAQRISARNVAKYDAFYLRGDSDGDLTVDRTTFGARDEFAVSPLTYAYAD